MRRVFESFKSHYTAHSMDHTKPYEGICELLTRLRGEGMKLAIVSNKADEALQALIQELFPDVFDCVVGARAGVPRKPAPDMVNAALHALGSSSDEAVYIGDSEVDVATARNAGLDCVSVTWGFRSREQLLAAGATTIVDSPEDVRLD